MVIFEFTSACVTGFGYLQLFLELLIIISLLFSPILIQAVYLKIVPNEKFVFYTVIISSVVLGIIRIVQLWTRPISIEDYEIDMFCRFLQIFFIIGYSSYFIKITNFGNILDSKKILNYILNIGMVFMPLLMILLFCFPVTLFQSIDANQLYDWKFGIVDGILAIPRWFMSWFITNLYCKAPARTTGYHISWWITLIIIIYYLAKALIKFVLLEILSDKYKE
jgi:hypothetical protein